MLRVFLQNGVLLGNISPDTQEPLLPVPPPCNFWNFLGEEENSMDTWSKTQAGGASPVGSAWSLGVAEVLGHL